MKYYYFPQGKKSPRSGRKHKGGGGKKTTFSGPQLDFVGSMVIDPYAGPTQDEMDDMIAEEVSFVDGWVWLIPLCCILEKWIGSGIHILI